MSRDSGLVCFGCYDSLDEEDPYGCSICGLPLCGEECQEKAQHKAECSAFQILGPTRGREVSLELLDNIPLLLDTVLILRSLALRSRSDESWFQLNQLQPASFEDLHEDIEEALEEVVEVFESKFQTLDGVDKETVERIFGILTINSFEIPNTGEATLQAIFATGCLPEHNCVPSGHRTFAQDLSITLRYREFFLSN